MVNLNCRAPRYESDCFDTHHEVMAMPIAASIDSMLTFLAASSTAVTEGTHENCTTSGS